jgi:hypothetical protein
MNIFFSIINNGYKYFALNFYKRWVQLGIKQKLVFVCTDIICYYELKKEGAECILDENKNVSTNFHIWKTNEYKKIVFNKLLLTKKFIENKCDDYPFITYIDTDIWVNFDFTQELEKVLSKNNFDIIFQDGEDYIHSIDECCILENDSKISKIRSCNSYCTGFMVFNSLNKNSIINLLSYEEEDLKNNNGNQVFINEKLKKLTMNVCCLPKTILPNFSDSFYHKSLEKYWVLHYTYLVGKEKIYYMKKNSHWILD